MNLENLADVDADFIPDDDEVLEINTSLTSRVEKLRSLDSQLEEVERQRKAMLEERSSLRGDIEHLRGLVSLTRRGQVPDDILREIFLRCLPVQHEAIIHSRAPPVLLTRVCSRWRRVALSTPRLWTSFHLPIPFLPAAHLPTPDGLTPMPPTPTELSALPQEQLLVIAERMNRRVIGIKEWLSRSGECPLTIAIVDRDYNGFNPYTQLMLNTIMPVRSRWQNITIKAMKHHLKPLQMIEPNDTPLLRHFEFEEAPEDTNISDDDRHFQLSSALTFLATKSLRFFGLKRAREDVLRFPVQWATLTDLILHFNHQPDRIDVILDLLRQCGQIRTCSLAIQHFPPEAASTQEVAPNTPPITLSMLRSFSIFYRGRANIPSAFDTLIIPNLQDLQFQWLCPDRTQSALHSLLSHCGPSLRRLSASSTDCTDEQYLAALHLCPQVTHIRNVMGAGPHLSLPRLRSSLDLSNRFLELLSMPDEQGRVLLPKVKVFESMSHKSADFTDAGVLEFIRRKQAGTVPGLAKLKSISIRFNRQQQMPLMEQLKPFIKAGLEVKFWYYKVPPGGHLPSAYAFTGDSEPEMILSRPGPPTELF